MALAPRRTVVMEIAALRERLGKLLAQRDALVAALTAHVAYTIGPELDPEVINEIDAPDFRSLLRADIALLNRIREDP